MGFTEIQIIFQMNRAVSFKPPNKNIIKIIDIRKIENILKKTFQMKKVIMIVKN